KTLRATCGSSSPYKENVYRKFVGRIALYFGTVKKPNFGSTMKVAVTRREKKGPMGRVRREEKFFTTTAPENFFFGNNKKEIKNTLQKKKNGKHNSPLHQNTRDPA